MSVRDVEAAIEDEEAGLALVASLLTERRSVRRWPEATRRALAVALDETTATTDRSAWLARGLRRHLFGPRVLVAPIPTVSDPSEQDLRRGERVRMDLARLVPLRAGRYLLRDG